MSDRVPEEAIEAGNAEHLDEALGWLLESRHVHMEVVAHFWHIADGAECDCEASGRVQARASVLRGEGDRDATR